jgi:hypothetical protein
MASGVSQLKRTDKEGLNLTILHGTAGQRRVNSLYLRSGASQLERNNSVNLEITRSMRDIVAYRPVARWWSVHMQHGNTSDRGDVTLR